MALEIKGLAELRARLDGARVEEAAARALAERLAAAVRDRLSTPPGTGGHDLPWLRIGGLRDSIAVTTDELDAVVGTSHPAAVPLETQSGRTTIEGTGGGIDILVVIGGDGRTIITRTQQTCREILEDPDGHVRPRACAREKPQVV